MKILVIAACLAGFSLLPWPAWSQPACHAGVAAAVEVPPGRISLADLLAKDTCPALLRAAARIPLGAAPLMGSDRVLDAAEVNLLLRKVAAILPAGVEVPTGMLVPERVTVRRSGPRASCADLARRLGPFEKLPAPSRSAFIGTAGAKTARVETAPQELNPQDMECGASDRIPQWSALERMKTVWNPALNSWDVSLGCTRHQDCVPFLVRVRKQNASSEAAFDGMPAPTRDLGLLPSAGTPLGTVMVRRGQTVRLLWDQYGVRLIVPATCLDPGDKGQTIRARIALSGRIVRAIVVNAGELRTAL
jgi:hypothetical protein